MHACDASKLVEPGFLILGTADLMNFIYSETTLYRAQ